MDDATEAPDYGSGIFPQHAALLAGSGLSAEVVQARGYTSADNKAQLKRYGFGANQLLVPALVVPMWDVFGGRGGYQARPDEPRASTKNGRLIKYETPGGERIRLDVHPFALPRLRNPQVPLFITEGVRKGDALVNAGLCAVALTGVWNWRGRNGDDGLTALADWENVALSGRPTYIVFDSDVVTKSEVHEAMRRLRAFLERRGAAVRIIYLPSGEGGTKVGADDYLLDHGPDEMIALAEDKLRRAPEEDDEDEAAARLTELLARVPDEPGGRVLDDLAAFLARHVAFPLDHHLRAVTLWVLHTWVHTCFESTPRLAVTSPEKGSGKTRVLEVIEPLVHAPVRTESISVAATYRLIELRSPTLLLDEVDAIFGPLAANHEDLRAVLNAGHRKGAVVYRCVGDGGNQTVVPFRVYAPVALAGIGHLPDTVADRSIHIRMRRRRDNETVAPFRLRDVADTAADLRERAQAWAARHAEYLVDARAELPPAITDRAADVWEPIVILADRAGGEWPRWARTAADILVGETTMGESLSSGLRLLADIRVVFDDPAVGAWIANGDLVRALKELDESPWDDLHPPLTKHGLAKRLKPYGIGSRQMRNGHERHRAYYMGDFDEAWSRYSFVPPPSGSDSSRDNGTTALNGRSEGICGRDKEAFVPGQNGTTAGSISESVPRPDLSQPLKSGRDARDRPNKADVPLSQVEAPKSRNETHATPPIVHFVGGESDGEDPGIDPDDPPTDPLGDDHDFSIEGS